MIERLSRNKRNIVLALLGLLVVWFAWSIRSVVNPLLIGYLLAFILHPLAERVQLLGFSRRTAVNLVFLGGFLVAVGITFGLVMQSRALVLDLIEGRPPEPATAIVLDALDPTAADEEGGTEGDADASDPEADESAVEADAAQDEGGSAEGEPDDGGAAAGSGARSSNDPTADSASDEAPPQDGGGADDEPAPLEVWLDTLQERLDAFAARINGWVGTDFEWNVWEVEHMRELATDWVDENKEEGLSAGLWVLKGSATVTRDFFGGVFALGSLLFLVPLYCYYLLFELERLHGFVVRYIPKTDRQRLSGVGREIGDAIAAFFRGRLSVCLFKGLTLSFGLWITGVDYALLFGMLSGFLSLIPFVGAAIGFVIAFFFAIVEHGVLGSLLRTGIVYLAAELFEGYVLVPRIMGESLGLHPLAVIFAIFAGGAALGMLGIVIALPVAASLVILVRELVLPAMQRMADEEPGGRRGRAGPAASEGGDAE